MPTTQRAAIEFFNFVETQPSEQAPDPGVVLRALGLPSGTPAKLLLEALAIVQNTFDQPTETRVAMLSDCTLFRTLPDAADSNSLLTALSSPAIQAIIARTFA